MRVPSARRFVAALQTVEPEISSIQRELLRAHYLAPDHTASAEEISLAAGGKSWRETNLLYGKLGTKLRDALRVPVGPREQKSSILAVFHPPAGERVFLQWRMHRELAAAIQQLGWFEGEDWTAVTPLEARSSAVEGLATRRLVVHRHREQSLRRAKLRAVMNSSSGRLVCEVPGCGFDFAKRYGPLGEGFAEVHHLKPLALLDGPIETTLEDLAVVCANCHRMIHVGNQCRELREVAPRRRDGRSRGRSRAAGSDA